MNLSFSNQNQLIAAANTAVAYYAAYYTEKFGNKHFFSREDVEDMAATTVMKAYGAIDKYDPKKAKLTTWVSAIAANCVKDAINYRMRRLNINGPMNMENPKDDSDEEYGADEVPFKTRILDKMSVNDTDSLAIRNDLKKHIEKELDRMTDKRKRIARMLTAGYTPKEMADAEGCTTTAIYKCVYDIRAVLKESLEDWDDAA